MTERGIQPLTEGTLLPSRVPGSVIPGPVDVIFDGDEYNRYELIARFGSWGDLSKRSRLTRLEVTGPFQKLDDGLSKKCPPQTSGNNVSDSSHRKVEIELPGFRSTEELVEIGIELASVLRKHYLLSEEA